MSRQRSKRGFLDADIIIQTGKCSSNLLKKVVGLFDECYLHERIYTEVKFPPKCKEILESLVEEKRIILIEDRTLLESLGSKGLFLLTLEQACNFFNKGYYQDYYSKLQKIEGKGDFLEKLKLIGNKVDDIGEIRTLQMIIALFTEQDTDNYFISNDGGARNSIVLNYANDKEVNIQGISLMGLFHHLKNVLPKEKALNYVKELDIKRVRVYNPDGSRDSVSKEKFIDIIYEGKYVLKKMGYIKLVNKTKNDY